MGYLGVSSKFKYLRFLTGRHDLPFFCDEEVEVQKSFLDACLKGIDAAGWLTPGKLPPVSLCIRQGNPGFNDAEAECLAFPRRDEMEWPIARTVNKAFHLQADGSLSEKTPLLTGVVSYEAPQGNTMFRTDPFPSSCEVTGHPTARLSVALQPRDGSTPSEMDLFLTLRHYDTHGQEIFYTGAVGDPVPVVRGWLRLSLRKLTRRPTRMSNFMPERDYLSTDVEVVKTGQVYTVDIELWPTSVVVEEGETLALEISSCDSEGVSLFGHNHPNDRPEQVFKGRNEIHISPHYENYLQLPTIPKRME